MTRRKTIVPLMLLPILLAVCLPVWGQEAEDETYTIKIFHPDGKDAESFVRSRHVVVGGLGKKVEEKDGVMVCKLHHPRYNFQHGSSFVETFKVIKPNDDQVVAEFKKQREVLLLKSMKKPGHWEVAGFQALYPKPRQQDKPSRWLPASFYDNRMNDEMFELSKYRYEALIDDNLIQLKNEDPEVRSRAMHLLGVIKPDDTDAAKVIDALAGLINSEDKDDRASAMHALGEIGGQHAQRYVPRIAKLLDSKIAGDRAEALSAICMIGGREAQKHIPRIIELMQTKPGPAPHGIVYALGELGGQAASALPALLDVLKAVDKDDHNDVSNIIIALGKIGPSDPKVVNALTPLLDHENFSVRLLSQRALDGRYFKRPDPEKRERGIN